MSFVSASPAVDKSETLSFAIAPAVDKTEAMSFAIVPAAVE